MRTDYNGDFNDDNINDFDRNNHDDDDDENILNKKLQPEIETLKDYTDWRTLAGYPDLRTIEGKKWIEER